MILVVLLLILTAVSASPSVAQVSELTVEVGASRILPPSGVEGDAAEFVVGGLRGSRYDLFGTGGYASLLVGHPVNGADGGDFVSGEAGAAFWRRLGAGWSAGLEGYAFGFQVADPFSYRAGAVEGAATLRWQGELVAARLAGTAGTGRSRTEISTLVQSMRRQFTVREVLSDDLWRYGSTLEVLVGGASLSAGVAGGIHRSSGGAYRSAGLRLVASSGRGALEVRGDVWRTPDGNQTTGGIAFYVPLGGWRVRGVVGRPEPDPLLLAEPGRQAGGMLIGRRILGSERVLGTRVALHRVVEKSDDGARVRFTLKAPAGVEHVELLGDFTLWEPVTMTKDGTRWTVDLDVASGTWHFGFMADDTWYLPDDVPDAVPDEWGRRSATLVIEGAES
jgi:hypothetical protein